MNKLTLKILPGFFLTAAAAILLIPLQWLFAWILAAVIHEAFHLLAVWLFHYPIRTIILDGGGAVIEADIPIGPKMAICSLAGPLGGLFLLLFVRTAPRVALCGMIQSLYNLLPLCHLDGGRALYGLLLSFMKEAGVKKITVLFERIVIFLLVIASLYALFMLKLGMMPLIFVSVLLLKNKKSLAKAVT